MCGQLCDSDATSVPTEFHHTENEHGSSLYRDAGKEEVMGGASGGEKNNSDYQFVYLGYSGSRTHVHADVLRSYSWSINIAGKKRYAVVSLLSGERLHTTPLLQVS